MGDPVVGLTRRLQKAKKEEENLEVVLYAYLEKTNPAFLKQRFSESSLQQLQELGELLSENLGLDILPGPRRRHVAEAWSKNIITALVTFFKAKTDEAHSKPCSWCKSYCNTACEACGQENAHLICTLSAHGMLAEFEKRVCRTCAPVILRSTILVMTMREKKHIASEMMGRRITDAQEVNRILMESTSFAEGELHRSRS